jgi:hypothetical protein
MGRIILWCMLMLVYWMKNKCHKKHTGLLDTNNEGGVEVNAKKTEYMFMCMPLHQIAGLNKYR